MTKATAWNAACCALLVACGIFIAVCLFGAWSA